MSMSWFQFLPIIVVTFVAACAPPSARNNQADSTPGTAGDVGGGGIGKSTKEQVILAIDESVELFKTEGFYSFGNVFHLLDIALRTSEAVRAEKSNGKLSLEELTKATDEHPLSDLLKEVGDSNQLRSNLERSKIYYDMTSCPGVVGHVDAAVSQHSLGANICFNVQSLTRLPPLQLKSEIFALLVHEYLHLMGYREEIAQKVQSELVNHWDQIEGNVISSIHQKQMDRFQETLSRMNRLGLLLKREKNLNTQHLETDILIDLHFTKDLFFELTTSFLLRTRNRIELAALNKQFSELLQVWPVAESENVKKLSFSDLQKFFCGFSEIYFKIEMALVDDHRKDLAAEYNYVVLKDDVTHFQCDNLPPGSIRIKSASSQAQ